MLRENGTTRLNVVPNPAAPEADRFLQAVKDAAAGDFAVLGEIGRGAEGVIIYLAREASSQRLVALRLQREGTLANEFTLELLRHLDDSMPAPDSKCFKCGKSVAGWARFCGHCGADLAGAAPASGDAVERAVMLEAVKGAVSGQYEVYGEMSRNEGGGAVYFACDVATGKIVALRLTREAGGEEFSLGLTTALKPIARSLGVRSAPTQAHSPAPSRPANNPDPAAPSRPAPAAPPRVAAPPATVPPPLPPAAGLSTGAKALVAGIAAVALVAIVVIFTLPKSPAAPVAPAPVAAAPDTAARPQASPVVPAPAAATSAVDTSPVHTVAPEPAPPPPKDATVRVSGLPAGAEVRVDGRIRVGRSLAVPPGQHALSIAVAGYQPRTDTLRLKPGETVTWSPALVAVPKVPDLKPKPAIAPGATCAGGIKDEKWTEAYEACMREALAGSATARRNVGMLYERGKGISRSDENAARWYESAASAGDAEAMYLTGRAYERGRGVKKNQATALLWYTRAAEAGELDAQMTLGDAYEKGHLDVKKDKAAALAWYTKAAAQGNKDAANKVKDLSR